MFSMFESYILVWLTINFLCNWKIYVEVNIRHVLGECTLTSCAVLFSYMNSRMFSSIFLRQSTAATVNDQTYSNNKTYLYSAFL